MTGPGSGSGSVRRGVPEALFFGVRYEGLAPRTSEPDRASAMGFCLSRLTSARMTRVFLLSPANSSGIRMQLLLRPAARFDLAQRLRRGQATIGEAFQFASGLYFRGKLAYARAFARPPQGVPGDLVIAPGAGLVPGATPIDPELLRAMGAVPVDEDEPRFTGPLEEASRQLDAILGPAAEVVLLGSVASPKYVGTLLRVFGPRLLFPSDFVGRGDMSRGGLMLRSVKAGTELTYAPVEGAVLHGKRPPKLPR